jgi:hypothetical protein
MASNLNWSELGRALRESAMNAMDGELLPVDVSYMFLLDNPECFIDSDEWPADMPAEPNIELIWAYYSPAEDLS